MFLLEIKRALKRKNTFIALVIGIVIVLFSIYDLKEVLLEYSNNKSAIYLYGETVYNFCILLDGTGISQLFIILLPLIATIPFGDSYKEDIDCGVLRTVYTRESRKNYLFSKFIANYIVSFIIITILIVIDLLILNIFIPVISYEKFMVLGKYNETQTFFYQNGYMTVYILLICGLVSFIAASYSSIALVISTFVKNKYIICIIPFAISILILVASEVIPKIRKFTPLEFLSPVGSGSIITPLVFVILVNLITFFVFYKVGKKYEAA